MVKFAHLADVHLGGWKQKQIQELNFESFKMAIDTCIKSKVDFVLIAGDLFDSAYPPIEVLKEAFAQFKRLKDEKVPCFLVAGSHDYSITGKTFLDVLEKAGFCKNVANFEEDGDSIVLNPSLFSGAAIYGYPGRMASLEIENLKRVKLNDAPGMFRIVMLHTTIDKAKGDLPIDSVNTDSLPPADYYALGHLHMDFQYENFVYPGPIFPNNFQELEGLKYGRFYIIDTESQNPLKKIELKIKECAYFEINLKNSLEATEKIISEINKKDIENKIVLLRVSGELENGKISDIKFSQIEEFVKKKGAYFLLKNTHDLKTKELELDIEVKNTENVEEDSINLYSEKNPCEFNKFIPFLMESLSLEKQEGEKSEVFSKRLIDSAKKILKF